MFSYTILKSININFGLLVFNSFFLFLDNITFAVQFPIFMETALNLTSALNVYSPSLLLSGLHEASDIRRGNRFDITAVRIH